MIRLMLETDVQPGSGLRAGLARTGELSAHHQPTTFVWSTDHDGQIRRQLPGWETFTGQAHAQYAGEMSLRQALHEIRSFEAACNTFNTKVGLTT